MDVKNESIWIFVKLLKSLFAWLPPSLSIKLGAVIGEMLWAFSKKRVDRAEKRAVEAMGVGITKAREIVKGSYANLGRSASEILRLSRTGEIGDLVSLSGEENLKSAFGYGRGVIFLTAHFGNWELLAASMAARGYPMNAIGAPQRDPRITDLIAETRKKLGVNTISKGFNLKSAVKCLKNGEILGILIDQDVKEKGIIAPFLGLPASTPYGPVKMAHKLGSKILPVFIVRKDDLIHHEIHILPALEDPDGKPFGEDIDKAVAICNDVISRWIRMYPDHWLWLYPRWASTLGK